MATLRRMPKRSTDTQPDPATRARCVAEQLWPGAACTVTELSGGITNQNYRVETPAGRFVVRVFAPDAELLGIDRDAEAAATKAAAGLRIGAELIAYLPECGAMVTRFVEGAPIAPEQMLQASVISRLAEALRRLHAGPSIPGVLNPYQAARDYYGRALERGVDGASDYAWGKSVADRIERALGFVGSSPCHGDLLNANFLDDGSIRILDWEYAGMGDPRFDLANLSINHGYGDAENRALLGCYFGEVKEQDLAAVNALRFMSGFREATWSLVQEAVSDLEFDFRAYADDYFERLRAAVVDPSFAESMAVLESGT